MSLRKPGPFLAVAALTAVLLTPVCGFLHRCGCTALGWGGEWRCNVRQPAGPHCPWCEHLALGAVASALILGEQFLVYRLARRRASTVVAAIVAVVALAPASVPAGALAWLPTDYPHFIVRDARRRLSLPEGPIPCAGGGTAAASCRPHR